MEQNSLGKDKVNQDQLMQQLQKQGYTNLSVVSFQPGEEKPDHTHEVTTVHVILSGELQLSDSGIHKPGEQFEIPAGTTHTAKAGPDGCTFIVGTIITQA